MASTRFRIHDVRIDGDRFFVGVTDEDRWSCEVDDGRPTSEAKTLAAIVLTEHGTGRTTSERFELFISRTDPLRAAAFAVLPRLADVAWRARDAAPDESEARRRLVGVTLEVETQ